VINSRRRPPRSGLSAPVTVEHRVISEPLVMVGQIKAQGDCGVEAAAIDDGPLGVAAGRA
jgi:hypothetical protein